MIAQEKREQLSNDIPRHSILLLAGNIEHRRNGDVMYPFRQDSDFLLLSGVNSPDTVLFWVKKHTEKINWMLFSEPISEKELLWGTSRMSPEEIAKASGISEVFPLNLLKHEYSKYAQEAKHIFFRRDKKRAFPHEKNLQKKLRVSHFRDKIAKIEPYLDRLRLVKTDEEIQHMKKAIKVTHQAFDTIRAYIKPGMYEYEIEALVAGIYRSHHLTEAYPTIVAGGQSACTLHYTKHDRKLEPWDIVLVDAGAEYEGYAADITRVIFLENSLSKGKKKGVSHTSLRQQQVYQSVLTVKAYAESLIRPWVKRMEYENQVRERMNEELRKLGLISPQATKEEIILLSRKYYPHSTSHFLGLDVHDIGDRDQLFEAGMVITCEPGIYIKEEGIGIRLEDDIRITETGCENLSKEIPL